MKRIGIDVGGTFTDLIFVDEEKPTVAVHKTSSTPKDPSSSSTGAHLQDIDNLFQGPTVAIKLVLQQDGVKTVMITTEGFRDIIHIGRHKRPLNFQHYARHSLADASRRLKASSRHRERTGGSAKRRSAASDRQGRVRPGGEKAQRGS